jgi:hypothetical protein
VTEGRCTRTTHLRAAAPTSRFRLDDPPRSTASATPSSPHWSRSARCRPGPGRARSPRRPPSASSIDRTLAAQAPSDDRRLPDTQRNRSDQPLPSGAPGSQPGPPTHGAPVPPMGQGTSSLSEIDSEALCYPAFCQVVPLREWHRDGVNRRLRAAPLLPVDRAHSTTGTTVSGEGRGASVELELGCRAGEDPGMPTVPAALRHNENATACPRPSCSPPASARAKARPARSY